MNVTAYQEYDKMWIAADSSPSLSVDKETMRFREKTQLSYSVDDQFIVCVGQASLIRDIILDYAVSVNRSIEELSNILREYFIDWARTHPDDLQSGVIEVIVCTMEGGQTKACCLSPAGGFEPLVRTVEQGKVSIWSIGEQWEQAVAHTLSMHDQGLQLFRIFPAVYQGLACPEIGGTLTVHQIDTTGTCLYLQTPIHAENQIKYSDRGGAGY